MIITQSSNLFRANLESSEVFKCYADTEYGKKKEKEKKKLMEEISRRTCEGYNV